MMRVSIVANMRAGHQSEHAQAMASGLFRHGVEYEVVDVGRDARHRVVVCWGWRQAAEHRAKGRDVLVMERGYLGDRFKWTSLGWNGLNGRATFPAIDDPSRLDAYFVLKDWRDDPYGYALVLGQVRGDAALMGVDIVKWYRGVAAVLAASGYEVRFRPHPVEIERRMPQPPGLKTIGGTLEEALSGAAVAVAYNSNSLTDAVVSGIPIIAADRGAVAWPVASHSVPMILKPERREWAARLAWAQWTIDEIADGTAWSYVKELV